MKFKKLIIVAAPFVLFACSKNDTPQNTEPANYAETKEKLIQNPDKDSVESDSIKTPTAMPPQTEPTVGK
ncbi:hypothetical protein [Kaistella carnis]|uniref:hypothetical protein n=1 Tax=Kaistella carnis TaxID=1241979 RepID=UPI0028ACB07E|nr:hypothetical protein [Kaistella carnis]